MTCLKPQTEVPDRDYLPIVTVIALFPAMRYSIFAPIVWSQPVAQHFKIVDNSGHLFGYLVIAYTVSHCRG